MKAPKLHITCLCVGNHWWLVDSLHNRPVIQKAIMPHDIFVVNFDALAQASDFRIERKQIVFLCWMQNSNPGSLELNFQQTECLLTNHWASEDQAKNFNSIARPYDQCAFSPLDPTADWLSRLAHKRPVIWKAIMPYDICKCTGAK